MNCENAVWTEFPAWKTLDHGRGRCQIQFFSSLLTEVRHDSRRKAAKSFRISSGNRRVYTTFAIEFETLGETQSELLEQ